MPATLSSCQLPPSPPYGGLACCTWEAQCNLFCADDLQVDVVLEHVHGRVHVAVGERDDATEEPTPDDPLYMTDAEFEEATAIYFQRCSGCHELDRVYARVKAERDRPAAWMHVVTRMRGKAPSWISAAEAERIITYLRERTTPKVKPPDKVAPDTQ